MISLAALNSRHSEVEAELDWYFTQSEGELGLSSNFPVMAAQMRLGRGGRDRRFVASCDLDARLLEMASRTRRISRVLEAIGPHAEVLRAWALPQPPGLGELGELAGVVLVAAHRAGFVGSDPLTATSMLSDLCRKNPMVREHVLRDAERMRREAFRAYAEKRKENKPCRPS